MNGRMYNPLKYVDPSGYRYYGYDEGAYYRMIDEMTRTIQREWHLVYESAMESAQLTISMACGLYSHGLDTHGNGSGNHGSPGGGRSVQNGSTGNGQGDGTPTLPSQKKGVPGSSVTNPASADHLVDQLDAWYTVGDNKPFYLNALTIDLSFLSKKDLTYVDEKTYKINLFTYPYMFLAPDLAMSLGEITLIDVGYNMYKIDDDTYDFNVNNGEYFSNWRNFATSCAGILHGGINEPTFLLHPATYHGGPFEIIFQNTVYIRPKRP